MLADGPYAYAKACGIIGKSFIGKRIQTLAAVKTLGELDRLIFPELHHDSGSDAHNLLSEDLERRIEKRAVKHMLAIVNCLTEPPEILLLQTRASEYTNLKTPPGEGESAQPDFNYYRELKESLVELTGEDRTLVERILSDEISLYNCIWALRLRSYYHKNSAQIIKYLTHERETRHALELPLDTRASWQGWKWERFLNPEQSGEHWKLDPRFFQNAASQYLYQLALHGFHRIPMSVSSIFCFIRIKQFEENILTSMAQGLGMGMECADILKMLEVAL
jgi:hypothetical protein